MATFTVPNRNFNATPNVSPTFSMPQKTSASDISIQLTSANWSANPGRRLIVLIESSLDGGVEWSRTAEPDTFTTGLFRKDGGLPAIILSFDDDGTGTTRARLWRVTVTAPDGNVNAGFVATF